MTEQGTRDRERRENLTTIAVLAAMVCLMLAVGAFAYSLIGTRPRTWSYNVRQLVPAQTYSSSRPAPPPSQSQRQVELPSASEEKGTK